MKKIYSIMFLFFGLFIYSDSIDEFLEWHSFQRPFGATVSGNYVYISNLGREEVKSGGGYISKINLEGVISSDIWVEDLNIPKGMCVNNLILYVVDINVVKGFKLSSAEAVFNLEIPEAKDLTGITVLDLFNLVVSDTKSGILYKINLNNKIYSKFIDDKIEGVTGLFKTGSRLYFASIGDGVSSNGRIGFINIRLKFARETTMLKPFFVSDLMGLFYGISTHGYNDIYFTDMSQDGSGRVGVYFLNDHKLEWINTRPLDGPALYWQRVDDFHIPVINEGILLRIVDVH